MLGWVLCCIPQPSISHAAGTQTPLPLHERVENQIRDLELKTIQTKLCYIYLFHLDKFSGMLPCAASPAALLTQGGKWGWLEVRAELMALRGTRSSSSICLLIYSLKCRLKITSLRTHVEESSQKGWCPDPLRFPLSFHLKD